MTNEFFSIVDTELRNQVPKGLPLIVVLAGASDVAGVSSQLDTYFSEKCLPRQVLSFSNDEFLDYRSRRPIITFSEDHLSEYAPEQLELMLAYDHLGAPFLILAGYEPDFKWDAFVETVLLLVDEFEVSRTAWSHAIPMPVPHTRPIRMTLSGSREDLIEEHSVWKPKTKFPGTISHVLEYRLFGLGDEVTGFAQLVPHYLANTEYPDALITALNGFMLATGLLFDIDAVTEQANSFREQLQKQVSDNEENLSMVQELELRYDNYMKEQESNSPLLEDEEMMPTADQLGTELERFLQQLRDDPGSST